MKKYSIKTAVSLWEQILIKQNVAPTTLKNLKTALKHIFPKTTNLRTKQFDRFCEQTDVGSLKSAVETFDCRITEVVKSGQLSAKTMRNYRSSLKKFMEWVEREPWWFEWERPDVPKNAPLKVNPDKVKPLQKIAPKGQDYFFSRPPEDFSPEVARELRQFRVFRLSAGETELVVLPNGTEKERRRRQVSKIYNRRLQKIGDRTQTQAEYSVYRYLSWIANDGQINIKDVNLSSLLDLDLIEDYSYWLIHERKRSHSAIVDLLDVAIPYAKFITFDDTRRGDWSDCDLVMLLRDLRTQYNTTYKQEKQKNSCEKWKQKLMTHEEARKIVIYLFERCAEHGPKYRNKAGKKRSRAAIIHSFQIYLIYKFLVYCPVRTEEVEQLALEKTLFRQQDENGNYFYTVLTTAHKNYAKTGKPRHYRIPNVLTKDLDYWLEVVHPEIKKATLSLESWYEFKRESSMSLSDYRVSLERRIEKAKKDGDEKRQKNAERKLRGLNNSLKPFETIRSNIEGLETVFFRHGGSFPEFYGTPHTGGSIYHMITKTVNYASQIVLGRQIRTNPHSFRHIAEAHVRKNQMGNTKAFATYIGHSEAMGDYYAEQISSEYEESEVCAFGWWL